MHPGPVTSLARCPVSPTDSYLDPTRLVVVAFIEMAASDDPAVFIITTPSKCSECSRDIARGDWITLVGEGDKRDAVCLECSDFDHLLFLPRGNAALTRRAGKHSKLRCIVLKWSRARQRYERQGTLVEEAALDQAEEECLADAELREQRAERRRERDAAHDEAFAAEFSEAILQHYPAAPEEEAIRIACHACQRSSGRIGRSAAAREFDQNAIQLAVRAYLRHRQTNYDELLMSGVQRKVARHQIARDLNAAEAKWMG